MYFYTIQFSKKCAEHNAEHMCATAHTSNATEMHCITQR